LFTDNPASSVISSGSEKSYGGDCHEIRMNDAEPGKRLWPPSQDFSLPLEMTEEARIRTEPFRTLKAIKSF